MPTLPLLNLLASPLTHSPNPPCLCLTQTRCISTAPTCSALLQHAHAKFVPPLIPASFPVHHLTQALAIASVRPWPSHLSGPGHCTLCAATVASYVPPLSHPTCHPCHIHGLPGPLHVPIHANAPYTLVCAAPLIRDAPPPIHDADNPLAVPSSLPKPMEHTHPNPP